MNNRHKSGFHFAQNSTNAPTADWYSWINVATHYSSDNYGFQIAHNYWDNNLRVRGQNSNTWRDWRIVLESGNYNSYAPTLTGAGASGTWGINITGSASTVSDGAITTAKIANGNVTRVKLVNVIESGSFTPKTTNQTYAGSNGWTVERSAQGTYKVYKAGFSFTSGGYSSPVATAERNVGGIRTVTTQRWDDGPYFYVFTASGVLTDDWTLVHFIIA
jgi:hypothetical protein